MRIRKRKCKYIIGMFVGMLALLWFLSPQPALYGRSGNSVYVDSFSELKTALQAEGFSVIFLKKDIALTESVQVTKTVKIQGNGHRLYRGRQNGGTLIQVAGGTLTLAETEVSGEDMPLEGTASLLSVRRGACLCLESGSITGGRNSAGGPAIRVESGGAFEMQGGMIAGNQARATGKSEGKNAWGGAVYNGGTVEIFGGTICQNRASGFQGSGGLGGAVYNAAGALFRNSGGTIRDNDSRSGGDIYSEGVRQEVVSPTPDAAKKEPGGADAYQKAERGKKKQSGKKQQTPKGAEKNKNKENKKKKENTGRADDTGRAEGSSPAGDQSPDGNRGGKEVPLPEIHVSPRFFFDWEVQNYREEQWKRELSAYRGEERTRWSWRGLLSDKPGTYSVKMRIGKRSVTIPVTIVSEWEEPETHLQFCEPEGLPAEEVWYFSSDDLKSVRQWMKGREDLFSQAANREFGRIFGRRN